jgi:hypothetical protein
MPGFALWRHPPTRCPREAHVCAIRKAELAARTRTMRPTSAVASRQPQSERQTGTHQHRRGPPDSTPGNSTLLGNRAIGVHVPCTKALRHPNGHTVPRRSVLTADVGRRRDDQYNYSNKQAQQQSEKHAAKAPPLQCRHGKSVDEVSRREDVMDLGRRNTGSRSNPSSVLAVPAHTGTASSRCAGARGRQRGRLWRSEVTF